MNLSYDIACFFSNHFKEILKHFGCLAVHITLAPDFYTKPRQVDCGPMGFRTLPAITNIEGTHYTCVTFSSTSFSSTLSLKPRNILPFPSHTSASSVSCPGFWLLVLIWMHFLLRYISHNSETISATTMSLEFFPMSLSVNTPSCLR